MPNANYRLIDLFLENSKSERPALRRICVEFTVKNLNFLSPYVAPAISAAKQLHPTATGRGLNGRDLRPLFTKLRTAKLHVTILLYFT